MAGVACHSVDGVEDRLSGDKGMFGAQLPNNLIRWERRQMGLSCRSNQGLGERQAAAACRRLQDDVNIFRATEAMWEMDMPNAFGETQHVISIGAKLLQDCRMRNDDA